MDKSYPELHLENQLCFPLYAASRLTTKVYTPHLKQIGLTYPQYLVMLSLWQHGKQSVKTIGNRLLLDSNTLTPLLKRLEEKGLVHRKRSAKDERAVDVSLTNKGASLQHDASLIPTKIAESFKDSLTDEQELRTFHAALHKLIKTLNHQT